ncbi:MAG: hypothetical protein JSV33_06540 [bacterium]|nr:MAG: hypothetical protein JSV33_06540 [bacterium]
MKNYLGYFECKLDAKGRLMIPARFRHLVSSDTGGVYVISMGKERCLNLFSIKEWDEVILSKLHELPPGPEKRKYIRFFSTKSLTLNIDKAGRIAIPAHFLEAIGNPKTVVVVGILNYMEIWAPEDYNKAQQEVDEAFIEGDWEY